MKELIYLTGQIDFSFFTNEIGYFCNNFDKVHVIAYGEDKNKCDEIAEKYGFTYEFVNTLHKRVENLSRLLTWRRRYYVQDEIRMLKRKHKISLKTLGYVYLYGIYACAVENAINKHLTGCDEIYLYSFWLSRPAFAIASMNFNRNTKIKTIASRTHRYDLYEEENKVGYLPFRQFISENLDVIYFSSKDTYEYYINKRYSENDTQAKRKLSYLGTIEPEKGKTEKNEKEIVIASCANIIQRKRLDLIIKLVKEISVYGHKVKWIHIGDGELEDSVKQMAERILTLSDVEYVFVGRLADEEIYKLYIKENVDFFVNMSDSEGIPVSALEALSLGIPCIARNVGGNADAIIDDYDGVLVNKEDTDDASLKMIAGKINAIFEDSDKYMKMSQNAYKHWKNTFSGNVNTQRVCIDIIEQSEIPQLD